MVGFESNISTNDKKKQKIIIIKKGKSLHLQYKSTSQFLHTVRPKRKYNTKNLLSTLKPIFGKIALTLLNGSIDIVAIIVFVIINMVYC